MLFYYSSSIFLFKFSLLVRYFNFLPFSFEVNPYLGIKWNWPSDKVYPSYYVIKRIDSIWQENCCLNIGLGDIFSNIFPEINKGYWILEIPYDFINKKYKTGTDIKVRSFDYTFHHDQLYHQPPVKILHTLGLG